jgi:hypothetical protein
MPEEERTIEETREALLRGMTTGSEAPVEKVIHFANDDAPNYLRYLAEFENQPCRIMITTG